MPTRTLSTAALAFALATTVGTSAHAHSPHFCGADQPHPIDARLDRAIDASGGTTFDVREAQTAAYVAWDEELNRTYKALLGALDKDGASTLREAQRAWLAWDKAEAALTEVPSIYGGGTAAGLLIDGDVLSRRRDRVCSLQGYLEGVRENGRAE